MTQITAKELQDAIYRMFNTTDGKLVLQHWFENFVMTSPMSPSTPDNTELNIGFRIGRADFVKNIYLVANQHQIVSSTTKKGKTKHGK